MNVMTPEMVEALCAVIRGATIAQHEVLTTIDQAEVLPWARHSEAEGEAMDRVEVALNKLCVQLARIIIQAEHGIPVFDPDETFDRLMDLHSMDPSV